MGQGTNQNRQTHEADRAMPAAARASTSLERGKFGRSRPSVGAVGYFDRSVTYRPRRRAGTPWLTAAREPGTAAFQLGPIPVDQFVAAKVSTQRTDELRRWLESDADNNSANDSTGNRGLVINCEGILCDSARLCAEHVERLDESLNCPQGHRANKWVVMVAAKLPFGAMQFSEAL